MRLGAGGHAGGEASAGGGARSIALPLAIRTGLYATGSAMFLAGNAVYFTQVVGLHATQVGAALSIAGVVAFLVAVPAGRLADRLGARRVWSLACLVEGALYLCYPAAHGFSDFLVLVLALAAADSTGSSARGAYALAASPPGERVRVLAFVRTAMNLGFTAGALTSGLVLGLGDHEIVRLLPLGTGLVLLATGVLLMSLPAEPRGAQHPDRRTPAQAVSALRNRAFVVLSLVSGQLGVNQVLLTVVFPLWLVERTDAPHAALAWLYGTNTVLVVLFQVVAARGSETIAGALRAARLAAVAVVIACVMAALAHHQHGVAALAALGAAYVAVTGAELFGSASSWGLVAELTESARRAEYQGAWRLGTQLQAVIGPALCTWLTIGWGSQGFVVIAAVAVAAALMMPRLAVAAARSSSTAKPMSIATDGVDTIDEPAVRRTRRHSSARRTTAGGRR